jgi:branched-chain amino acid transport system substrate-binding protein
MVEKRQYLILFLIMVQLFLIPTLGPYRNIENNNACNDIPSIADVSVGSYIVPGVLIPPSNLIKIGILGDMKDVTGIHAWNGAFLAAKEINQAGGISIGGSRYNIGIVSKDTDEANPMLDITKGITAAEQMVNLYAPDFIIGGYRLEALAVYLDVIMDNHVPFISIGADSDYFCQKVLDNYTRYKYFFRTMPLNRSAFTAEFIDYIISLSSYLGSHYGGIVDKVAILREDLEWTMSMSAALNYYLPLYGFTVMEDIAFPLTITSVEMAAHWAQINATGAQITIPLISGQAGILMMTQYAGLQPGCLVVGIDKLSQFEMTWDDTGGACQYEVIPQPVYKTNKTSLTLPFWNSFIDMYDEESFYTGAGAYDSIKILIEAVNETQSLNPDTIIGKLEGYDHTTPFQGASGLISFTPSHDLLEGWPYNTYLFCQWNSYGTKEVLSSYNSVYPDSIVTGALKIPYWGINNLTGPQTLPGAFTLSSDASVFDFDGSFNLTWSNSVGANSYSIYYSYRSNLTRLVKIADNAISPFKISNLMTDKYYFVIVAHNSVGEELSNSIYVNVDRPRPGGFILYPNSEDPDQDGQFNLIWSESEGANNYSVYGDYSYITEIDQSLTLMADQTGVSPYNISGLREGRYYFAVEAHNKTGKTLSNCIEVVVQFPPTPEPEPTPPVIPGYNLYVVISMICIVSIILNKKRYK